MNKRSLAYGILFGSVAGAITALLTAPVAGKELRIQLKEATDDWTNNLKDVKINLNRIKNSFSKLSGEGKNMAIEIIHDIKTSINEWQKDIEPTKQSLFNELKEIQKTIEELELKTNKNA
ncbi:YtxH domain-containing protein [Bacillus sp. FJAT-49736]|uniref:YtxH domain-containing protein n=1 Tax=Bacillus sp. FJAT-49736 TaxID=2833582 RepID=UPI001BC8F5C0|nr:YtxH domain-containing protein [Bacillus sp. FJAT-49736]MBS4171894.1 YtxH domain-containing protein [Bacillus sp. FJAT-49736]